MSSPSARVRAEDLERELRDALVRLRPDELRDRSLRPGHPGLHECRERAVVRVAQRLHLDPLARDPVALELIGAAVAGERHELANLHLERRLEREAERSALVEERRHRDLPAAADLAEEVLDGHPNVGEEDLVELGLARDLAQRADLHARRVHVDDEVRQPRVARRLGIGAREQDAEVGDVRERRPDLLAVHDEVAVVERRARADAGEVGPGAGLREALAPDLLGGEERRKVARLLLLGAVRDDRRPGHADAR